MFIFMLANSNICHRGAAIYIYIFFLKFLIGLSVMLVQLTFERKAIEPVTKNHRVEAVISTLKYTENAYRMENI